MSGCRLKLVLMVMAITLNLQASKGTSSPATCSSLNGFTALDTAGLCVKPVAKKSWSEASRYCQSLGARIVIVDTQLKATAMNSYIETEFRDASYVWIGGVSYSSLSSSTHRFHATWVWSDCRAMSGTYRGWAPREPSGNVDKCAVIQRNNFQWNDGPCSSSLNSVCEEITSRPLYDIISNTDDVCPSSDPTTTTTSSTTTTTTTTPTTTTSIATTTTTPTTTTSTTTTPITTTTTTTPTTTTPTTTPRTTTSPTTTTSTTTTSATTTTTTTTPTTTPTTTTSTTTTPTTTATSLTITVSTTTTPSTTADTSTVTTTSTPTQTSLIPSTSSTKTTPTTTNSRTTSISTTSPTVATTSATTSDLTTTMAPTPTTTHTPTTVTTQGQTTSANVNPSRTIETVCTCFCKSKDRLEVVTKEAVNEKQEKLKRHLLVDKTKLTQTIARYTSAADHRPSSSGMGVTWFAVILIPFGLTIISDISAVCQILINKYQTG